MNTNEASAAAAAATTPDPMVRLYNKSAGTFRHGQWKLGPGFATVPTSVAEIWLSQFPDRVISANDALTSGTASNQENAALKLQLDAARRRIVDLEDQLAKGLKDPTSATAQALAAQPRPARPAAPAQPIRVLKKVIPATPQSPSAPPAPAPATKAT